MPQEQASPPCPLGFSAQLDALSEDDMPQVHRAPGFLRRVWPESLLEIKASVPGPVIASLLGKPTPPQRWEARQVVWQCV